MKCPLRKEIRFDAASTDEEFPECIKGDCMLYVLKKENVIALSEENGCGLKNGMA